MGAIKADDIVWKKVCDAIRDPERILGAAHVHVEKLRAQATTILEDQDRIMRDLDALVMERQRVITWARKGSITDEDMEYQLSALTLQEMALKRELATYSEATRLAGLDNWEEAVREYLLDKQAGMETLEVEPEDEEEKKEIFKVKRQLVKALVNRVTIDKRRELNVELKLDVLGILEQVGRQNFIEVRQAGTCIRTQSYRARRHPGAGGGSPSRPVCRSRSAGRPSR
jgi:hypothetical protein